MMKTPYRFWLATFLSSICGVSPMVAAEERVIEEVVVTAQKRSESVMDIPVAISVLTAGDLSERVLQTANEIVQSVPNLQASYPFGETQPVFSVRGQTMADYNSNQASPISFYVDEANIGPSFLHGMTLFDIERVEVLRGPQGLLYGKNTSGGAINLVSRSPGFAEASGEVTLSAGDYGRRHVSGGFETPIIQDTLALRAAFTSTQTDGYHKNLFPGGDDLTSVDTWSGRFTLGYSGESIDATLRYGVGRSKGNTSAVINVGVIPDGLGGFVDFSGVNGRAGAGDVWEGTHNKAEPFTTEFDHTTVTVNWDVSGFRLTSITSYLEAEGLNEQNTDGTGARMIEDDWGTDVEQFSQDFRIVSNYAGPFNFIAGLYYSWDNTDRFNVFEIFRDLGFAPDFSAGFATLQTIDQKRRSAATYLHTTYDLSERLTLTAGVRYTRDKGSYDVLAQFADFTRTPLLDVITPDAYPKENARFDDNEVSGKIGLDYQLGDYSLLYGSYSRGYRSSALNGGALFSVDEVGVVKPEIVDAYELGFKTMFVAGKAQFSATAFYYDYNDQQLINFVGFQQHLENADEAEILGAEFELTALIGAGFSVTTTLGFLDTEYSSLTLSNTVTPDPLDMIDLSGNELISSPEVNASIAANYSRLVSGIGELNVGFDATYIDDQWFSAYNDALDYGEIRSEAYWITSARVAWSSLDERYSVALWVKNLANEETYTYGLNSRAGFGFDFFTAGLPRRYGVELSARF